MSDQKQMQQQQQQAAQQQMEQQVQQQQGQTIQVQISHDASQQLHAQAQVVSSGSSMIPTSTMVMSGAQQTMLQQNMGAMGAMQGQQSIAPMPPHTGSTTITTMSALGQQQMADWGHGRVQVIQQPMQNPTYVQQVYNPQGQLLMPGNIALHPGMNQGSIQVIAAGKPFQQGQMQHMLTAQGKSLVQGQTTSFPGYATIPTSGNNQTLVISQIGMQHLMPQQQQQQQPQQQQKSDMQKMMGKTNGSGGSMKVASSQQQNVTIGSPQQTISSQAGALLQQQILSPIQYTQQQRGVPQGATQAMQFAPWQPAFGTGLPQGLTWAPNIQSPTALLTTQGNQIFIRGPQPDQGMFQIHNAAQQPVPTHQSIQTQQMGKAQPVEMQQKAAIPKTFSNILPNSVGAAGAAGTAGGGSAQARVASSVSTQTHMQAAHMQASQRAGNKVRTKTVVSRNVPSMATQKSDAANQTKGGAVGQALQPKLNGNQSMAVQQDKMMRVAHAQVQAQVQQIASVQQVQQQIQAQQIQMFQQQIQPKPSNSANVAGPGAQMMMQGQIVTDNRPVMPVVSLPPGVSSLPPGALMPPMVVHNVDQVQGYAQQNLQMLASAIPMKTEEPIVKNESVGQQAETMGVAAAGAAVASAGTAVAVGGPGNGPGRPEPEPTPMDSSADLPPCAPSESDGSSQSSTPREESKARAPTPLEVKMEKESAVEKAIPAKAMVAVKPQVLTHVIEGFVIQEASEPFAVNRSGIDLPRAPTITAAAEEPPKKKQMVDGAGGAGDRETAKCEMCGKVDLKSKFKNPSKRFCSIGCSKRYNVGCSTRVGLYKEEGKEEQAEVNALAQAVSNSEPMDTQPADNTPVVNPVNWTVSEVYDFIKSLPGCEDFAEEFAMQEIDGQALMLLNPGHLMSAMSIKLGPALKIVSKIEGIRVEPPSPHS